MKLTIPKAVSEDRFVEGFIKLTGKDVPSLSVPFIGYYGDWGKDQIIEAMNWDSNNQNSSIRSINKFKWSNWVQARFRSKG